MELPPIFSLSDTMLQKEGPFASWFWKPGGLYPAMAFLLIRVLCPKVLYISDSERQGVYLPWPVFPLTKPLGSSHRVYTLTLINLSHFTSWAQTLTFSHLTTGTDFWIPALKPS